MGKAAENKLLKLNSLLSSSFELFTTKGFSKTSISDIVEHTGVAKGTFYLYFKDKYDLRDKLTMYKAEKLFDHAIEHSGYQNKENFEDKLIAVIDDILDQLKESPTLTRFINKNLSWGVFHKAIVQNTGINYDDGKKNYVDLLKDELEKDPVKYKNPEIMLYMVIELVSGTCTSVIINNDPVDLESYKPFLHQGVKNLIHGFAE